MTDFDITSPHNERIKRLVRLRERSHRDDEAVFVVEGPRLFGRAIDSGLEPLEIYVDGSVDVDLPGGVLVEPSALDRASYRRSSQGLIAVFAQFPTGLERISLSSPALVIATERIEKPGNIGAILRTAAAVGADGVITVDTATDLFNPNVVRSSTGALFSIPVAATDIGTLRSWLDENSISLVAAAPGATKTLWHAQLDASCAVMVGAEDTGLSAEVLDLADVIVSIPMLSADVDSLNASVSAAVLAYEALRQRS